MTELTRVLIGSVAFAVLCLGYTVLLFWLDHRSRKKRKERWEQIQKQVEWTGKS